MLDLLRYFNLNIKPMATLSNRELYAKKEKMKVEL